MRAIPGGDGQAWAAAAGEVAGVLAVLSQRIDGDRPGQLAAGAAAMTRLAQLPRTCRDLYRTALRTMWGPGPGHRRRGPGAEGGQTAVAVLVAGVADLARISQAAQLTDDRVRQGRQSGDAYVAIDNT
jgi:hypothetical protein